ncbi:hypothetical protein HDU83_004305 [Entophlyctis luteolus]|nr:hypothetical protein HDU83_004305 [Entophlyctis luteolus]
MLPSAFSEKDLEDIEKEKRKFAMTPERKVKYDAWAKAVENKIVGQNLHIITRKLTIALQGWRNQRNEKLLDAGWLQEFEKEFKNNRQGEGGANSPATPEDVAAFLETIPAPLSDKEKDHLSQYNDAKFQFWKQFRKPQMKLGAFQKEVEKDSNSAELVKKAPDENVDDIEKKEFEQMEHFINGCKDKAFEESWPLTAKILKEKYFFAFQKELDETIARLVLEARDENFANNESLERIMDFCKIEAFGESRISQFFGEADFVAFQKEMDDKYPGYPKVAQLVIEASEENFTNKEKVERMIKCCKELPISKIFQKDFNVIKTEVSKKDCDIVKQTEVSKKDCDIVKLVEEIYEENFTSSEKVERVIIVCRDKAFQKSQESQSSIATFFKTYDVLIGAIFGQKSAEIEKLMEEMAVDYFFQFVGFVVGLIPFVPPQITDYISSFGKKVNDWSSTKAEAHDLVAKAQSFLTLLLSTSLQLSEFHGEDHDAAEKLCELVDDMADLYALQFQECKSMLDNPPKVFGFGKIWKRTFDSALDALTEIAADTRDKVSLFTSTVASRTLDEVGKQGKILEFLKQEQSSLARVVEVSRTELKDIRQELNSIEEELQITEKSLIDTEFHCKTTEIKLEEAEHNFQEAQKSSASYSRLIALTAEVQTKITEIKSSIRETIKKQIAGTLSDEMSFAFFENNIVFGGLLYCYGMCHKFETLLQIIEEIEKMEKPKGSLLENYSIRSDANFAGLHLNPVHDVRLCLEDINKAKLYKETYWRWTVSLKKKDGKWVVKFRSGIRPVYRRKAIVNHEAWCSVLDKLNNWLGGAENSSDFDSDEELTMSSHDLSPSLEVEPYNSRVPLSKAKLSIGKEYPKRKSKKEKQVDNAP